MISLVTETVIVPISFLLYDTVTGMEPTLSNEVVLQLHVEFESFLNVKLHQLIKG